MSRKKTILHWVIETHRLDHVAPGAAVAADVWGFDAHGTALKEFACVSFHVAHSTYSQLLDAVASLIHAVNTDRQIQPEPPYPHVTAVKPSDWNTDGDVPADKLTGGAS
jgi:hypothetical protein